MERPPDGDKGSMLLEFAVCGVVFTGIFMGMVVIGIWMYNVSQAGQAARIAAHHVAVTGDEAESRARAKSYLDKTAIACRNREVTVYSDRETGYGLVKIEMNPLFPGLQKLVGIREGPAANGMIPIRKEAAATREFRLRPENRRFFN